MKEKKLNKIGVFFRISAGIITYYYMNHGCQVYCTHIRPSVSVIETLRINIPLTFGSEFIYPKTSSDLDIWVVYCACNIPGSHGSYNIITYAASLVTCIHYTYKCVCALTTRECAGISCSFIAQLLVISVHQAVHIVR